jgi:hypothetical protein
MKQIFFCQPFFPKPGPPDRRVGNRQTGFADGNPDTTDARKRRIAAGFPGRRVFIPENPAEKND